MKPSGAVRAVLRLPLADKVAAARVLLLAVLVEVGVRAVPLPRLGAWLGVPLDVRPTSPASRSSPSPPFSHREERLVRTCLRVMRDWPFGEGSCLRQSLLLGHLLRRRRPSLRIGVGRDLGDVVAHAWLEVSGTTIGDRGLAPLGGTDAG